MKISINPDWMIDKISIDSIKSSAIRHGFELKSIETMHNGNRTAGVIKIGEVCGCRAKEATDVDILSMNLPRMMWRHIPDLAEEFFSLHRKEDEIVEMVIAESDGSEPDAYHKAVQLIEKNRKGMELTLDWPIVNRRRFQEDHAKSQLNKMYPGQIYI
jgi:hypothetical protein